MTKQRKKKEKLTVKDFKMWLRGLAEFQDDNWTPNAKQWKAILEIVEQLEDNVQYVVNNEQSSTSSQNTNTQKEEVGVSYSQPAAPRFQQSTATRSSSEGISSIGTSTGNGGIDVDITKQNSFV